MATVEEVAQRQRAIAEQTAQLGHTSVAQLAAAFSVTTETIRRDLKTLEHQGALRRVHGGAVALEQQAASNAQRLHAGMQSEATHLRHRQAIGLQAMQFVPKPQAEIFIDAGATTEAFATVLARHYLGQRWHVVTNSPVVAKIMCAANIPDVSVLGGTLRGHGKALTGKAAISALQRLRADVAFLGTNAVESERGFATSSEPIAEVKREMLLRARHSVILSESFKAHCKSEVPFASFEEVGTVISERPLPASPLRCLRDANTQVVIP
ncbi:DeoR/GlpR family DNA-binding transcription regulator [Corynebacterium pseudopelargi]|uniref:Lactose phosphotransferase system repressor n=1 Tax=Corynebacterium pseudopelargi TaxID=2080757 RepID=A0A3G6IYQ0_9CORY|nr:DeoR/GlpR family DNA-binding transcription regulator [Corynebacterium pseudopelargi]AZA09104.1 Glycerol-3-phosphate regulon repressor [Corynebacterium pseudopelargi]